MKDEDESRKSERRKMNPNLHELLTQTDRVMSQPMVARLKPISISPSERPRRCGLGNGVHRSGCAG